MLFSNSWVNWSQWC